MRRSSLHFPLLLGLGLIATPPAAHAFGNANAKVVLHLTPVNHDPEQCAHSENSPPCDQIDTSGGIAPNFYFMHVLVVDGSATEGVAGVHFGINWDDGTGDGSGIDIYGWTLCATLQLDWPPGTFPGQAPAVSNLVTWDSVNKCQRDEPGGPGTGVVANVGYFYLGAYSPATARIAPGNRRLTDFVTGKVVIANCNSNLDVIEDVNAPHHPSQLGSVAFWAGGSVSGYNPCARVIPVRSETWSGIKTRF